ncbi:hypothetical protein [Rhizobium mongolense]
MPNRNVQATAEGMPKTDKELLRTFRDLESDVCGLSHMAHILGDLLDANLTPMKITEEGAVTIMLSKHELDTLSFAWNDVSIRSQRLRDAFYAAYKGEVLQ